MRLSQWLVAAGTATSLVTCSDPAANDPSVPAAELIRSPQGFITTQPAQAVATVHGARLIPLLITGNPLPGSDLPWAPTPDGLGAYRDGREVVVFANHELTASGVPSSNGSAPFLFSRVSRLRIDPFTLRITSGDYVEDGSGGYIRFCSATWVGALEGFPSGCFLTGGKMAAPPRAPSPSPSTAMATGPSCPTSVP